MPNEHLRRQRLRRGWSLNDLACAVVELGGRAGERNLALTAKTVGRWERGESNPRSPYPKLLCMLFNLSADELGLAPPGTKSPLASGLMKASALADSSSALVALEGGLVAPMLCEFTKNGHRSNARSDCSLAPDSTTVELVSKALGSIRRLEDRVGAPAVTGPALELRGLLERLSYLSPNFDGTSSGLTVSAELSHFLGWLAYDAEDYSTSRAYYQEGLQAAQEAADHDVLTCLAAHVAILAVAEGKLNEAIAVLDGWGGTLSKQVSQQAKALLWAVTAKVWAIAGERGASETMLERSRTAFDRTCQERTSHALLYFMDRAELTAYEAVCRERLGELALAQETWQRAASYLPASRTRDRARCLIHMAHIDARQGEVDSACNRAKEALSIVVATGSTRCRNQIEQLRTLMEPWEQTSAFKSLNEELAVLG